MYNCEIKKTSDTMLADIEAIKNYISARYVKKTNPHFSRDDANSLYNVRLLNEQDMKILGLYEFELKMFEWTRMMIVIILDLETDFDVILRMSWHR